MSVDAAVATTVLVSTHQIHQFESLADYVGVLRSGRLLAQLARDELRRIVGRYLVEVPAGWQTPRARAPAAGTKHSGRSLAINVN
jgi:ABC-2 type transport system ATP-binding protein